MPSHHPAIILNLIKNKNVHNPQEAKGAIEEKRSLPAANTQRRKYQPFRKFDEN
jgi:hypothetical protein